MVIALWHGRFKTAEAEADDAARSVPLGHDAIEAGWQPPRVHALVHSMQSLGFTLAQFL
jgi:hypothetical protein